MSAEPEGLAGFGYRLKAARKALEAKRVTERVTQSALSNAVGMSGAAYGHWESGRAYPDLPTVVHLAELLGVRPAWLAFGDGQREAGEATLGQTIKVRTMTPAEIERAKKIRDRAEGRGTAKKQPARRRPKGGAA